MSMTSDDFYERVVPIHVFEHFTDLGAYSAIPDDWVVMAGDVAGSTEAIAEGRYKAVNMVGAACITAVLNACGGVSVPFVFGGDGGIVVVPGRFAARSRAALEGLQAHAQEAFGLPLRAAAIPVARLRREGFDVRVRKLILNRQTALAMFSGGGLERAEEILKRGGGDPDVLRLRPNAPPPDLEGLSCRWEPLVATRGSMMALIVRPIRQSDAEAVLKDVLAHLDRALNGDVPGHAPANDRTLRFRWPPRGLAIERRALALTRGISKAWLSTAFTSLAQKLCHLGGIRIGDYDGPKYAEEIGAQTDFRKFDGCFRTVLDCTNDEIGRLRRMLDAERAAGRLVYGIHTDRSALMTCLVFSLAQGQHVHFIDAAGGGFAKAAEGLKAQEAGR
jgi:hypothetical protein